MYPLGHLQTLFITEFGVSKTTRKPSKRRISVSYSTIHPTLDIRPAHWFSKPTVLETHLSSEDPRDQGAQSENSPQLF